MPKHHGSSRDLRGPTAKSPGCCGGVASVAWDAPGGGISHWMSLTDPKDPKGPAELNERWPSTELMFLAIS